ncbi:MAG: preprotein translocase subunit YajC [Saprospiraceae bacterium]
MPMVIVLFIVYFFFIRPQAKKQKSQKMPFLDNLKKGDEVVTSSGMIGKISKIEGNIVTLHVNEKVFIDFVKQAISKDMTESLNATPESK